MSQCPKCNNSFDAAGGFCPYSGHFVGPETHCGKLEVPETIWSTAQARIGEVLDDRYEITGVIGEGGMGIVFSAKHKIIERKLAIKMLPAEIAGEKNTLQRFVREAKAASRISHPNIVEVTDFGVTPEGLPYFVMEQIEGVTLKQLMADRSPLPVNEIAAIVSQIASALDAAHKAKVAHRDLKPENIFVSSRGFVKIVDFGIAKIIDVAENSQLRKLTRAGSVFGTPEYMSPEQASGSTDVDHRADIYALGILVYELIVGTLPIKGENLQQTIAMQILQPPPSLPAKRPDGSLVPEGVRDIVNQALVKDRNLRLLSIRKFMDAFSTVENTDTKGKSPGVSWKAITVFLASTLALLVVAFKLAKELETKEVPPPKEMRTIAVKSIDGALFFVDGKQVLLTDGVLSGDGEVLECRHSDYKKGSKVQLAGQSAVECIPSCKKKDPSVLKNPFEKDEQGCN